MAFGDIFETMQSDRVNKALVKAQTAKTERQKRQVIQDAIDQISGELRQAILDSSGEMDVKNFSEVTASLRNELSRVAKPLITEMKKMGISGEERNTFLESLHARSTGKLSEDFNFFVLKKAPAGDVRVVNLDELILPNNVNINDDQLNEIIDRFTELQSAMVGLKLPAPIVNIPDIAIPQIKAPDVRIPDIDISPITEGIVKELRKSLEKLRTNKDTNPLAVRLSNGQNFIDALDNLVSRQEQAIVGFPGKITLANNSSVQIAGAKSLGDGSATVASAGTAVQLSTSEVKCRRVIVYANEGNTGNIFLGSSSVSSSRGAVLQQARSETLNVRDLRDVYIDAATNGDGVTYVYEN